MVCVLSNSTANHSSIYTTILAVVTALHFWSVDSGSSALLPPMRAHATTTSLCRSQRKHFLLGEKAFALTKDGGRM